MKPKYIILSLIVGLVVLLDQLTKVLVVNTIPLYKTIPVIPGFLNLTHYQNPGIAFGIFSKNSSNLTQIILMCAAIGAVFIIFYFYTKADRKYPLMLAGFSLIMGGAVGNLIDRFRMSKVVDFIEVYLGSFIWPAFNIADSAITVGVVIFAYYMIFKKPENF